MMERDADKYPKCDVCGKPITHSFYRTGKRLVCCLDCLNTTRTDDLSRLLDYREHVRLYAEGRTREEHMQAIEEIDRVIAEKKAENR